MSKKEPLRKKCSKCEKLKNLSRDYYASNSNRHSDGRVSICKQCLVKGIEVENLDELYTKKYVAKVQDILLEINRPYMFNEWSSAIEEAKEKKASSAGVIGYYLKNIQLNHKNKNWLDSDYNDKNDSKKKHKKNENVSNVNTKHDIELNTQNEKDVLRLLGYDPFEYETEIDRPNLFNKLVDYLDESTLEDGFKLTSVIEIVRTFNQMDKINAAISGVLSGTIGDTKGITSLVNAKDKLMSSILKIAQENGISIRHATNKSQGAGTLSGILKQLGDYDIHEAEANLFDTKTAHGIRQIADISNESIYNQLGLDENDMNSMIRDQRQLIEEYSAKADKFEEENRLLRVEITELKNKQNMKNL